MCVKVTLLDSRGELVGGAEPGRRQLRFPGRSPGLVVRAGMVAATVG